MLQIVAWHDRTQADHQHQTDLYGAQGYRTLSLSVYNTAADPRYACVLIKRPQVIAEQMVYGLNSAQFQQTFNDMSAKGMGPHIVTATGDAGDALFAASFIPAASTPLTRFGLTPDEFTAMNQQATKDNQKLVWFDCYGTPGDERYIAVWWPNPEMLGWNCDGVGETLDVMQQRFDGITETWAHVAQAVDTPSGNATTLYYDGLIGATQVRFGITSAEYQALYNEQYALGLVPLRVCGQGTGDAARFGVVFGQQEQSAPSVFTPQGPTSNAAIDAIMKTFMQAHNIRSSAVAVVSGTRLVYAQGYTWAEPGFPAVQPTTLFRQASCSKIFVAASIYRLMQQRRDLLPVYSQKPFLQMLSETTLQSVLDLLTPEDKPAVDPKFATITLLDLLTSTSGLDQGAIFTSIDAATAANQPLPATRTMLTRLIASRTFTKTPGDPTNVVYGNTDYFLLGEVVRALAGAATFEDAVNTLICKPLQMQRVRGSRSAKQDQGADEAWYQLNQPPPANEGSGELTTYPGTRIPARPLMPYQYGGMDMEMYGGAGGLSVAVTDMARLVASLSLRTGNPVLEADTIDEWMANAVLATKTLSGPDAHGYHGWDYAGVVNQPDHTFSGAKGGSLPGTGTMVVFKLGSLSYIGFSGGQGRPGVTTDWLAPLAAIVPPAEWATIDLFPKFGMPTFLGQVHPYSLQPHRPVVMPSHPIGRMQVPRV